jgi:hypothetical protein
LLHTLGHRLQKNGQNISLTAIQYPSPSSNNTGSLTNDYRELLTYLIEQCPTLACQIDSRGSSPLHYAAYRSLEVFHLLLPHSNQVIRYLDDECGNLMDLALNYAHDPKILDILIKNSPPIETRPIDMPYCIDYVIKDRRVLMHYLESQRDTLSLQSPFLRYLITDRFSHFRENEKHYLNLLENLLEETDIFGNSIVHFIQHAKYGTQPDNDTQHAWQWLLSHGEHHVRKQNHLGETIAHLAARRNDTELLTQIIQDTPDLLDVVDHCQRHPIHNACHNTKTIKLILSANPRATAVKDAYGKTILDRADTFTLLSVGLIDRTDISLDDIEQDCNYWNFNLETIKPLIAENTTILEQISLTGNTLAHIILKQAATKDEIEDEDYEDLLEHLNTRAPNCFKQANHAGYQPLEYLLVYQAGLTEKIIHMIYQHHSSLLEMITKKSFKIETIKNEVIGDSEVWPFEPDIQQHIPADELEKLYQLKDSENNSLVHTTMCRIDTLIHLIEKVPHTCKIINDHGESLLHYHSANPEEFYTIFLLKHAPELANLADKKGRRPIHFSRNLKSLKVIIRDDTEKLTACDYQNRNIWHYFNASDCDYFQYLIEHTEAQSLLQQADTMGNLPLHFIIHQNDDMSLIQEIIRLYPEAVMTANEHGIIPAMNTGGNLAKLMLLLEIDPRCINHTDTSGCNIAHYQPQMLRLHPELAAQADQLGRYPIHTNALNHSWMLEYFFEHAPLSITLLDNNGRNALHYAVQQQTVMPESFDDIKHELKLANDEPMITTLKDHTDVIDELIHAYPHMLTQKDKDGKQPIDYATEDIKAYLHKNFL